MTAQIDSNTYDANLLLEDATSTAKTATGQSTAISFKPSLNKVFKAVFDVTAIDTTDTDETYVLSVEVSADNSTFYEVATIDCKAAGSYATGKYELAIMGNLCAKRVASTAYVRCVWTLGGTTPSLKFIGYLAMV